MIKAIILDLNGILITSEKLSDRFARKYHVPAETFLAGLKDVMPKVRRPGARPAYTYWKPWFQKWNVQITGKEFFDFWFSGEKLNRKALQLIKKVRRKNQRIKILVLSNNFRERSKYYTETFPEMFHQVDYVYYSWQTGHVKPSKGSLRYVLRANKLRPAECLYVDDRGSNVEVALALGCPTHLCRSVRDMEHFFRRHNII